MSDYARNIDFHQKAVLSDDVGIGVAHYLMLRYFGVCGCIDVDVARRSPFWRIERTGSALPDYLLWDANMHNIYILECKGTQTSKSNSLEQVRRGTEQVCSIKLPGRKVTPIVIGTCMLRNSTEVLIIDPEDDEGNGDGYGKYFSKNDGNLGDSIAWVIDEERFLGDMKALYMGKLLSFAGFDKEAFIQIPEHMKNEFGIYDIHDVHNTDIENVTTEFGTFRGRRRRLFERGGFIDIFQGLHSDLVNSYSNGKLTDFRLSAPGRQMASDSRNVIDHQGFYTKCSCDNNYFSIQSISPVGTLVEVNIESGERKSTGLQTQLSFL